MVTVAELMARSQLLERFSDSARLDTELLLAHATKKDRAWLYTWPEKKIEKDQLEIFERLFQRRLQGEPIAYLLGYKEFWSLHLKVDNSTLIPRPDTEVLVECALKNMSQNDLSVLDLGAGTGAIALAIAKEKPRAVVLGVDSIASAVALAKENAIINKISNAEFQLGNWFDNLGNKRFDLIVSNPPYIDSTDPLLNEGDVRFEPKGALTADANGYADLQYIIENAKRFLSCNGQLIIEHGWQQAEKVRELFKRAGYNNVATQRDYSNNERVTVGSAS